MQANEKQSGVSITWSRRGLQKAPVPEQGPKGYVFDHSGSKIHSVTVIPDRCIDEIIRVMFVSC